MTMKTERFEMRTSAEFARVIDEWRRRQTSIPSRSDAVRTLVAQGLMFETLDNAVMKMLDFLADSASYGKIPGEIAMEIIDMLKPFIDDLEEYTNTKKEELNDLRRAIEIVTKFKEEDPEGFAKSPFAAKPRRPKSKKPKSPTE